MEQTKRVLLLHLNLQTKIHESGSDAHPSRVILYLFFLRVYRIRRDIMAPAKQ